VVETHLTGEVHFGLDPLPVGDVCRWLAADVDGPVAMLDALAHLRGTCAPTTRLALGVQ
jgi:hypothetical protein